MGTRNAAAGRLKGLTSPRKFAAMQAAYEAHREGGRISATCEVVFAHAWAPEAMTPAQEGEQGFLSTRSAVNWLRAGGADGSSPEGTGQGSLELSFAVWKSALSFRRIAR